MVRALVDDDDVERNLDMADDANSGKSLVVSQGRL